MVFLKILLLIIISIACGVLYRAGGKGGKWYFDSKARDVGCMLLNTLTLFIFGLTGHWWQWLVSMILTVLAYTTYHKWLNPLFGHNKDDVHWYGWFMHGFALGFALIIFYQHFKLVLLRSFVLGLFTMVWSIVISNDNLEEWGRGFLVNITIPIL